MPDAAFEDPRLVRIYDALEPARRDLDAYLALVEELGATSVLDVGCGTGVFACLLAARGKEVTGVDPAPASLEVANAKPEAPKVHWLLGTTAVLSPLQVDLVTMTGNVAQVFLSDEEWAATIEDCFRALRPGGHLVFETRDAAMEAWKGWSRESSYWRLTIEGIGPVQTWFDLLEVDLPFVTFRDNYFFEAEDALVTSQSTLRFRSRKEIVASLQQAGFGGIEIRDAPDRPGLEMVFVVERP